MTSKKEVTTKDTNTALSAYGDYSGQGFEGTDKDDVTIPFIGVLQKGSPQVELRDDCKVGMLFNTVMEEPIDNEEGIYFVPAVVGLKEFVEWVPRKRGGGLVNRHKVDSPLVAKAKEDAVEEGLDYGKLQMPSNEGVNDLVETKYIYAVQVDKETQEPMGMFCLAFTSSKIKVFNNFNTRLSTIKGNPPPFAHLCKLTTIKQSHAEGDYYNFKIAAANGSIMDSLLDPESKAFQAGLECYSMVMGGGAVAAYESQQKTGEANEAKDVF